MGRIKTDEIKNITKLIIDKYTLSSFSDDFETNKNRLKSFPEEFPSKKVLNKVAGYITFKYKKQREEEKKLLEPSGGEEKEEKPEAKTTRETDKAAESPESLSNTE